MTRKRKIHWPQIYVEPEDSILKFLESRLESENKEIIAKKTGSSIDSVRAWYRKDNWVPVFVLRKICKKEEYWGFLSRRKLRGRSGRTVKFKKELTPEIARLLGFILTDGSLIATEPKVCLCQIHKKLLREYTTLFEKIFETEVKFNPTDKDVTFTCSPARYLLVEYWGVPLGDKKHLVRVPERVSESNDPVIIKEFLAGVWDGDGYFSLYDKKVAHRTIRFGLHISSPGFSKDVQILLKKLGIVSITYQNGFKSYELQVNRFDMLLKFYKEIATRLWHKKLKRITNTIRSKKILCSVYVDKNEKIEAFLKEIYGSEDRNFLFEYVKRNGVRINNQKSIESWIYNPNRVPLLALFLFSKLEGRSLDIPELEVFEDLRVNYSI